VVFSNCFLNIKWKASYETLSFFVHLPVLTARNKLRLIAFFWASNNSMMPSFCLKLNIRFISSKLKVRLSSACTSSAYRYRITDTFMSVSAAEFFKILKVEHWAACKNPTETVPQSVLMGCFKIPFARIHVKGAFTSNTCQRLIDAVRMYLTCRLE